MANRGGRVRYCVFFHLSVFGMDWRRTLRYVVFPLSLACGTNLSLGCKSRDANERAPLNYLAGLIERGRATNRPTVCPRSPGLQGRESARKKKCTRESPQELFTPCFRVQ